MTILGPNGQPVVVNPTRYIIGGVGLDLKETPEQLLQISMGQGPPSPFSLALWALTSRSLSEFSQVIADQQKAIEKLASELEALRKA